MYCKKWLFYYLIFFGIVFNSVFANTIDENISTSLVKAKNAYHDNQYSKAEKILDDLVLKIKENKIIDLGIATSVSDIYISIGQKQNASDILKFALKNQENIVANKSTALAYDRLAVVYRSSGNYSSASSYLQKALEIASQINDMEVMVIVLNDMGHLYVMLEENSQAEQYFRKSYGLAQDINNSELITITAINLVRANIKNRQSNGIREILDDALNQTKNIKNQNLKLEYLLNLGDLYRISQVRFNLSAEWRKQAYNVFTNARKLAEKLQHKRALSFSLGYIGQLYEDENRLKESLKFSRQAQFYAQEANSKDGYYRWTWQSGRLLKKLGRLDKAIQAYRQAITVLATIKYELILGSPDAYKKRVAPLYIEYADLLLSESDKQTDLQKQAYLKEVRSTLEHAKMAEMEDHFQSECLQVSDEVQLDEVAQKSAIFYPILFKDRMEVLVTLPTGLVRYSVKVNYKKLAEKTNQIRVALESYDKSKPYQQNLNELYNWLIKPVIHEIEKQNIKTLVFVPDGPLRSIPQSTLYDGKHYLVEKYAIATTPSLLLTDPRPIKRDKVNILIGGLTDAVQGFTALPNVNYEVNKIKNIFPSKVYMNKDFVLSNIEPEMSQGSYSIVHVATHAQFDRDHTKSFMLAYNDKMTMDKIEETIGVRKYKEAPLELLVMSACQTATGDDKAALGLAGVAIKAGARSALATLWFVSDEATAILISEFYQQLKIPDNSKAQALRSAQLKLINNPKYNHPSYWAPFLMIGNWL